MKYNYKGIEVFKAYDSWQADYVERETGKRFALHRCCMDTRAQAIAEAKANIDFLNLLNEGVA